MSWGELARKGGLLLRCRWWAYALGITWSFVKFYFCLFLLHSFSLQLVLQYLLLLLLFCFILVIKLLPQLLSYLMFAVVFQFSSPSHWEQGGSCLVLNCCLGLKHNMSTQAHIFWKWITRNTTLSEAFVPCIMAPIYPWIYCKVQVASESSEIVWRS